MLEEGGVGGEGGSNDVIWDPQWKRACGSRNGVAFGVWRRKRVISMEETVDNDAFTSACMDFIPVLVHVEPSVRVLLLL